jgi:hypothetical protein
LSASGGTAPYSWSISSGALPAGLTLASSGQITGTPTTAGSFSFTVKVADSSSPIESTTANFGVSVSSETVGTPVCGLNNNQNPYIPGTTPSGGSSDYDTFVPPAAGGSYVDALSGCTWTRITDNNAAGTGKLPYYSTTEPFNANDQFLSLQDYISGGWEIVTAPADEASFTPGTVVVPTGNMPGKNGIFIWDRSNPNLLYYATGTQIRSATITGLPGCISTHNCTMTTALLHDFSTGSPVYASVWFSDEPDISQDGDHLLFIGATNSGTTTFNIDVYQISDDTDMHWYRTTGTGTSGSQPGPLHKGQLTPNNEPVEVFVGSGSETGEVWWHLVSGSIVETKIQNSTNHLDTGFDINGTEIFLQDRLDSSIGTDPCASDQWNAQSGGGGAAMTYYTDPTNAGHTATCTPNKNWAQPEISYRGGPSQPWFAISFFENGNRTPSPEYFTNDSKYIAPTCTQVNTTTSGTCWYPYEEEVLLVKISTDMNSAGDGPLATVFRMGWVRSRSSENFWAIPKCSLSHDGNYIACASNMAYHSGCSSSSVQSSGACADTFVVSAASGAPLFGGASSAAATSTPSSLTVRSQTATTSAKRTDRSPYLNPDRDSLTSGFGPKR